MKSWSASGRRATIVVGETVGGDDARGQAQGDLVAIRSSVAADPRTITLEIVNLARRKVHVQISGDSLSVHRGQPEVVTISCEDARGWYDLTVTCPDDPLFLRRLAGHIVNGAPSIPG
ncbi:phospholipase domain-containing protein [Nonomuraea sp. NPDC000554]|uniref:phospholipase domain-containing protein n=1 Tax=Nonomuraea sp. NPDC000554 TaxID=3154259 RepID=UPI003324964C